MKFLFTFLIAFFLLACGGKPVAKYATSSFEEPVLVNVKIDPEDVESGEFIQDELTRTVVNRLHLRVTKNVDEAKSYILVNIYAINTSPANYDDDGNVIRYSVNAAIKFAMKDKFGFWTKNIVANQYVSVKAQSLLSQTDKQKAEKLAIKKALDAFVAAVVNRAQEVKSIEPKTSDGLFSEHNDDKLKDNKPMSEEEPSFILGDENDEMIEIKMSGY